MLSEAVAPLADLHHAQSQLMLPWKVKSPTTYYEIFFWTFGHILDKLEKTVAVAACEYVNIYYNPPYNNTR